jgi:hypothetical protein
MRVLVTCNTLALSPQLCIWLFAFAEKRSRCRSPATSLSGDGESRPCCSNTSKQCTIAPGETFSSECRARAHAAQRPVTAWRRFLAAMASSLSEFGGGLCAWCLRSLYNLSLCMQWSRNSRTPPAPAGCTLCCPRARCSARLRTQRPEIDAILTQHVVSFRLMRHGKYLTAELFAEGTESSAL